MEAWIDYGCDISLHEVRGGYVGTVYCPDTADFGGTHDDNS